MANRGTRTVRIEDVSVGYLADGRTLRTDDLGSVLFAKDAAIERQRKVAGKSSVEWFGICLERIPPGASRIRLDVAISSRAGLTRQRSTESFEVELRSSPAPLVLRVPFEGYWLVTQGHGCRTNHRRGGFGSDYAWDFVHFGASGRTVKDGYETTRRNEDSYSFDLPIFAPVDGTVARIENDIPDNEGLKEFPRRTLLEDLERPAWIFGNLVVIDAGSGTYVMLAHLRQGTVRVKPGDRVRAGDTIARCGNSGNTVLPHLHVQAMDRPDPTDSSVRGLPAVLASYREITSTGDATHKDILARVIAAGDPPENSIVVPVAADAAKP